MAAAGPDVSPIDCFAPGDTGLLGIKIGGLFGIGATSLIGILIPFFCYQVNRYETLFFFLRFPCLSLSLTAATRSMCVGLTSFRRAFAAGVVLMTGFVHVLGDAFPIMTDPCLGWSGDYPWACAIAGAAALITFNLEWLLHKRFTKMVHKPGAQCSPGGDLAGAADCECCEPDHGKQDVEGAGPAGTKDGSNEDTAQHARSEVLTNLVRSLTFEIGIVFHSIFIGITLGISSNSSTVTALMIALFFHQGNEGIALGCLFIKAQMPRSRYIMLAAVYILITPIGVAIGIGVSSSYNGESRAALGSEGVFDSVSAGILIYNGLVDLIVPAFTETEMPAGYGLIVGSLGFGSLYTGAAIMALIGKWA